MIISWLTSLAVFYGTTLAYITLVLYALDRWSMYAAAGFFPVAMLGTDIAQAIFAICVKRVLLGKAWPGSYPIYGSYYLRRMVCILWYGK